MTVLHTDRTIPLALNTTDVTFSTGLVLGWDFTGDDTNHKDGVPWIYAGATAPTLPKSGVETFVSTGPEPGVTPASGAIYDYSNATDYGFQVGTGDYLIAIRWSTPSTLPSGYLSHRFLWVQGGSGTFVDSIINEYAGTGWYLNVGGIGVTGTSHLLTWGTNKTIVTFIQRVSGVVTVYELDVTAQGNLLNRVDGGAANNTAIDSNWATRTIASYNSGGTPTNVVLNSVWFWNKSFSTTALQNLGRDMFSAQANSAVADAITITSPTSGSAIEQTSVISGTYTGTQPTSIQVQHGSAGWVTGTSATIGSGNWSATFTLSPASANTLQAREGNNTAITSSTVSNITVNSDSLSFTAPSFTQSAVPYRIFQRNASNQASVRVSGTYTGSPTSLEYSWNGGAWTALGGTLGSGAFNSTITLTGPAQGDLSVRFANKTSVFNTIIKVGVGDVWIVAGQSNHVGGGGGSVFIPPVAPAAHPNWSGSILDLTGTWRPNFETDVDPFAKGTNATGFPTATATYPGVFANGGAATYFGKLATKLMAAGIPTAFVVCSKGSTTLSNWDVGGQLNNATQDRATQIGGHKGVLWWQGESDTISAVNTTRSAYEALLNTIINNWATNFPGHKWVIMNLNAAQNGTGTGGTGASDTGFNAIHAAIANVGATNSNVAAVADTNGLFSQLHYETATEINNIADAAYNAIFNAYYAKHVTLTLVDSSGSPRANLSGLKWAFFDQVTPDLFVAPVDKGNNGSTDGSGVLSLALTNTSLAVGGVGWLVITNSDGTTTQSPVPKSFSAPVVLS